MIASDVLSSIHFETTEAFFPRETSIRTSESTRTVTLHPGGRAAFLYGAHEPLQRVQLRRRGPSGFRQSSAWRGFAAPAAKISFPDGLPHEFRVWSSSPCGRACGAAPELVIEDTVPVRLTMYIIHSQPLSTAVAPVPGEGRAGARGSAIRAAGRTWIRRWSIMRGRSGRRSWFVSGRMGTPADPGQRGRPGEARIASPVSEHAADVGGMP